MNKSLFRLAPAGAVSVAALMALALDHHGSVITARAENLKAVESEVACPRGNATLRGMYMSRGNGTIVGVGLIVFQGTIYFDGKGGIVNPFTLSVAGNISRHVVPGTYSINSDCTGSQSLGGGADNFDIRVSPDGNTVHYIKIDAGTIVSGTAVRVKDADGDID